MRPTLTIRHPRTPEERRRHRTAVATAVAIAAVVVGTGTCLLAQQQPGEADKGKARVVQRTGPELEVRPNAGGQVVVLFPQASGAGKDVEVTLVESNLPAPAAAGQPAATGGPVPTGREFVFGSKDARDQTVSAKLDASGQPRKFMMLAKVDGQNAEVHAAGGPEGVQTFLVAVPEKPKPADAQPQQPPAEGQPQQPQQPPAPPAQAAVIVVYTGGMSQ